MEAEREGESGEVVSPPVLCSVHGRKSLTGSDLVGPGEGQSVAGA